MHPRDATPHRLVLVPLLALLALGGGCDALELDGQLFACQSDADCASGHLCADVPGEATRLCVPEDELPDLSDTADLDTSDTSDTNDTALADTDTAPDDTDTAPDAPPGDTDADELDAPDTDDLAELSDTGDTADLDTADTDTTDATDTDATDATDADGEVVEPQTFLVTDDIVGDATWSAPHTWVLTRPVFVANGATLTIEAGVTVLAESDDADGEAGGLFVTRGARLLALGTAAAPIVFTSAQPDGTRAAGDWGGLTMLGHGRVNDSDGEGTVSWYGSHVPIGSWRDYGGVDDAGSCGELRHVRIEFAGNADGTTAVDGLFLGGCGAATVVDHVQVHRSAEDGVSVMGGAAPLRHLVVSHTGDDGLTWDRGYRGSIQFATVFRATDNALYGINDDGVPERTPVSAPLVYNLTLVGPVYDAMDLRSGTAGHLASVLVFDPTEGLELQAPLTVDHVLAGDLLVEHSLFRDHSRLTSVIGLEACAIWLAWSACIAPCANGDTACTDACAGQVSGDPAFAATFGAMTQAEIDDYFATLGAPAPDCDAVLAFDPVAWLSEPSRNNLIDVNPALADPLLPGALYPLMGSPVTGAGALPPATDPFGVPFDASADYIGAYEPGVVPTWSDGWTAFPEN